MGGALLYGMILLLTMQWFLQLGGVASWTTAIGWGLLGALLWWLFVPFAVAANEDCWHAGGYVTSLSFTALHILLWFRLWIHMSGLDGAKWNAETILLWSGVELFVLLAIVIVFGCNGVQGMLAISDNIREEPDRRDISEALRVFRHFRMGRSTDAKLSNLIAMVSASPRVYYILLGFFSLGLVATAILYLYFFRNNHIYGFLYSEMELF